MKLEWYLKASEIGSVKIRTFATFDHIFEMPPGL